MSQIIGYNKDSRKLEVYDHEMVSFLSQDYHESRYLESLSLDRLIKRIIGLTSALIEVNKYAEPVLNIRNGENAIAFIKALEECKIREQNVDQCITEVFKKFDDLFDLETLNQIYNQVQELQGNKCLFKFTDSQYVDDILKGKIRFCTASSYRDKGFNIAIQDDELNLGYRLKNLRMINNDGFSAPVKNEQIFAHSTADFHVSCFTKDFAYKLFALMEYDSCVVITNAENFVKNVKEIYQEDHPECRTMSNKVEYVDICRRLRSKLPIQFRKSSNYSYEEEYRFVGFPRNYSVKLKSEIFVDVDPKEFDCVVMQLNNKKV